MTLITASAANMLRSTIVIFAALLGVFYLKNKLYRHHITSLVIITVGAVVVGAALLNVEKKESASSLVTGIFLLLIGTAFGSMSYTSEEKIMMIYPDLDPCVLIGYEGLWMSIIWIILLTAF